ncbi:MAG: HD domain-containing protein [Clostridia bacterium]|nr:HD domain-containing protein [Clostridia bacterium]
MKKDRLDFYSPINLKSYNLNEIIRYQLSIMDNVDIFTRRHCENVGNLVCRICEYMKFKKYFIVYATTCAYIHDIGKIFLPKEILENIENLSDEQLEVFKTHTTLGYKACIKDPRLRQYADAILCHHESLDGTRISCWPYKERYSSSFSNNPRCRRI